MYKEIVCLHYSIYTAMNVKCKSNLKKNNAQI